jgi:hypothetical protein
MTSFRGEVKPSVTCGEILLHIKEPYEYERDTSQEISPAISGQVSPALLLDGSVCNCRRALVDESEMIRNPMGVHNKTVMVTVQGSP